MLLILYLLFPALAVTVVVTITAPPVEGGVVLVVGIVTTVFCGTTSAAKVFLKDKKDKKYQFIFLFIFIIIA